MPSHCLVIKQKRTPVENCLCQRCVSTRITLKEYMRTNRWKYRTGRYRINQRESRQRQRYRALSILSGGIPCCFYCGCDDIRLLEINHKNGGGGKEHLKRRTNQLELDIISNRRREGLEVACRVCNALHYLGLKFGNEITKRFSIVWN